MVHAEFIQLLDWLVLQYLLCVYLFHVPRFGCLEKCEVLVPFWLDIIDLLLVRCFA
jgi:hypothetical protein